MWWSTKKDSSTDILVGMIEKLIVDNISGWKSIRPNRTDGGDTWFEYAKDDNLSIFISKGGIFSLGSHTGGHILLTGEQKRRIVVAFRNLQTVVAINRIL